MTGCSASGKTTTEAVSETPQPVPARSTALPSGIQEVTPHEGPPSSDSVAGGPLPTTFASEETDTAGQPVVPSLNGNVHRCGQPLLLEYLKAVTKFIRSLRLS